MAVNQAQATPGSANIAGTPNRSSRLTGEKIAAITLDEFGMIFDCNRNSEMLFKYRRSQLVLQHVSMLLPQLTELELVQCGQPNARLRFLSRTGHHFQAITKDGERFACKLYFNLLGRTEEHFRMSLVVRPADAAPDDKGRQARTD